LATEIGFDFVAEDDDNDDEEEAAAALRRRPMQLERKRED
jgi:hypothetical protein